MSADNKPYVGISAITEPRQVKLLLETFPPEVPRQVMMGALVSDVTLRGERPTEKWAPRFPVREDLASLFVGDRRVVNAVHYCTSDDSLAHPLASNLTQVVKWSGEHLHAIQINMRAPSVDEIAAFKREFPRMKLILQVSLGFDGTRSAEEALLDHLDRYARFFDYWLYDTSRGAARRADDKMVCRALQLVKRQLPDLAPVFAGGIGPCDLNGVRYMLQQVPEASWDAEGKLRNDANELRIAETHQYVLRSFELVRQYQR